MTTIEETAKEAGYKLVQYHKVGKAGRWNEKYLTEEAIKMMKETGTYRFKE